MAISKRGKWTLFVVILFYVIMIMFATVGKGSEVSSTEWQVNIIQRTILAEAKGEGSNGMYAVACVIQQRSVERKLTGAQVCLQRLQFSCWNKATNADKQIKVPKACWQSDYALTLAKTIVSGVELDRKLVGFANHYHTHSVTPSWSKGVTPVAQVGNHRFFRL